MNRTLNGWKFVFAILVVLHHASCFFHDPHFRRCYLAVEFFFVVSGTLLAKSWYEKRKESPSLWVQRKAKKIYPLFIYSIAILVFVGIFYSVNKIGFISSNRDIIYELFFLNSSGITTYGINEPDWYISSMLLAGFFYMAIFSINDKFLMIIILPVIIFGMSIIVNIFHTLNMHSKIIFFIFDTGVIRALIGMGVGIYTYHILSNVKIINNKIYNTVVEIILCCLIYLFLIDNYSSNYDILIIPIFAVFVVVTFKRRGVISLLLESKIFQFFSKFSTSLYLTHFIVVRYLQYNFIKINTFEFVVASIIFAIISYYIVSFIVVANNTSIFKRKIEIK